MKKGTKTKHPGVWRLGPGRYRVAIDTTRGGQRRKRERLVDGTEREAVAARLELLAEIEDEIQQAPRQTLPNGVGAYALDWIARLAPRLKTSTADHYADVLAKRILPQLGEVDVHDVTRSTVGAWCTWAEAQRKPKGGRYSAATLNSWWRVLKPLMQDLAADHGLPDPTLRVRPPTNTRRDVRETRTLTAKQVRALLETVRKRWPTMHAECCVLAFTGMREGELRGLNCGDLGEGVITISRAVLKDGSVGATKTGAARTVPVCAELQRVLDGHLEHLRGRGYLAVGDMPLFPGRWPKSHERPVSARRSEGSHYATLKKASAAMGLGWTVGPQTLRRTLNSRLRESQPGELVRAILGHTTEEMTGHYYGADMDKARAAVASVMGGGE